MSTTYRGTADSIQYTNAGAEIASGAVVELAGCFGIAEAVIAATTGTGTLLLTGEHELAATTTDAWAIGDNVYWDSVTSKLTDTVKAGKLIGVASSTKANPSTTAKILLNVGNEAGVAAAVVTATQVAITKATGSTIGTTNEEVLLSTTMTKATGSTVGTTNEETLLSTTMTKATGSTVGTTQEETLLSPSTLAKAAGGTTGGTYLLTGSTIGATGNKAAVDNNGAKLVAAVNIVRNDTAKLVTVVNLLRNDNAKLVTVINLLRNDNAKLATAANQARTDIAAILTALKNAGIMATS